MSKYLEFSNNNIFDIDNLNNLTYNNQTYSNGFIQINNSCSKINNSHKNRNKNLYYTKKKIMNNSNTNRDDLSQIEFPNTSSEKYNKVSESIIDSFKVETIPIFKVNMPKPKSKDKIDSNIRNSIKNFNDMQKIYINKKCVKSFLDSSQYNDKDKSNSSIDEIKISLKKLRVRQNLPKTNCQKNIKVSISRNNKHGFNMLNQFINSTHLRHNSEKTFKISQKPYNNNNNTLNKIIIIFKNLTVQKEGRFNYIGNNNRINFLEKIINQQKDNIKLLREQNRNLLEKIQKMHEENMTILESINSLRMEIDFPYNNKINNNYRNSYIMDESLSIYNTKNNSQIFEENNLNINQIIYSLYDNNNLLSYDYENNEFRLIPVINEEFKKIFNKGINSLFLYNNLNNKLFIVAGLNNDQLFIYDLNNDKIQTKSTLKNNHMLGSLLLLNEKNDSKRHLICLSGKYNKKVEIYNEENDLWDDKILEEMPEERGDSYYLVLNDNYIYAFYGYNYILNTYLNDIVYYDLINNRWKRIMNNLLNNGNKGIKNHICYQNTENKYIYILGGDSNINKIIIDLQKKCVIQFDEGNKNENNDRFLLNNNFVYNIDNNYLSFFDQNYNVHLIDCLSNENKIIKYYWI